MNRRSDRQVLRLEELSELDFCAIMKSFPPPESAMFDHEVPSVELIEVGPNSGAGTTIEDAPSRIKT